MHTPLMGNASPFEKKLHNKDCDLGNIKVFGSLFILELLLVKEKS